MFQDVYAKGVIPLAAIQMTRPAKDNKFEIVTSHRIFVFRTDNEGETSEEKHVAVLMKAVMINAVAVSQCCGGAGCPRCRNMSGISRCSVGDVLVLDLTVRNTDPWS